MKPASSILILVTAILLIGNTVSLHSAIFGSFVFLIFLLTTGWIFGSRLFSTSHYIIRLFLGSLIPLTLMMIIGAVFYYALHLGTASVLATLIIISLLAIIIQQLPSPVTDLTKSNQTKWYIQILPILSFITTGVFAFRVLLRTHAVESIRSPWELLPGYFFIFVFLTAVALIILALLRSKITIFATMAFAALFFSITLFIYPLGYGFDPFIHQATEQYIADHGTISPKPFTYLGQYALIDTIHRITQLPIVTLDRLLLPILLVLFIPLAGWLAFENSVALALLFLLPLSTFAATTPQGVANALVIISLLVALGTRATGYRGLIPLWLLGLAAVLTHPIAGIPLLVFVFIWTGIQSKISSIKKFRSLLIVLTVTIGSVALPLLFALYGLINKSRQIVYSDFWNRIFPTLAGVFHTGVFETRFNPLIDLVYFFGANLNLVIIIGVALTLILFWRKNEFWPLVFVAAALVSFFNAILLLAIIDFSFLPLYEQSGYAERLLDLSMVFLLPIFLWGLSRGLRFVLQKNNLITSTGIILLIAGILTSSLYLTYPHQDAYTTEHGWSVGKTDLEAVRFVNQQAGDQPFIVLANQSVSAAALREFGFKYYFPFTAIDGEKSTAFYYPIPTGGPLYAYFLQMSYTGPKRVTISDAMDRAGVQLGYFIMNRYWSNSSETIERAKLIASAWWEFGNGAVTVFEFKK